MSNGYVFELTEYTRTLNENRRMAWNGFDVKRRHVKVMVVSALISFVVAMFMFVAFGASAGMGSFFVFLPLPFALIEGRSSQDMQLRYWQVLYDKKTNNNGKFILCNRMIDPTETRHGVIKSVSIPVRRPTETDAPRTAALDDLFVDSSAMTAS